MGWPYQKFTVRRIERHPIDESKLASVAREPCNQWLGIPLSSFCQILIFGWYLHRIYWWFFLLYLQDFCLFVCVWVRSRIDQIYITCFHYLFITKKKKKKRANTRQFNYKEIRHWHGANLAKTKNGLSKVCQKKQKWKKWCCQGWWSWTHVNPLPPNLIIILISGTSEPNQVTKGHDWELRSSLIRKKVIKDRPLSVESMTSNYENYDSNMQPIASISRSCTCEQWWRQEPHLYQTIK